MSAKTTVLHRLSDWADATPHLPAQKYKVNGEWKSFTVREYCDRVHALALYLESKGITSKDIGVILAYNSPQWVHLDLAMVLLGGMSAGLYPNSTPKDMHFVLNQTEGKLFSVQDRTYFEKLKAPGYSFPATVKLMVVFDGDTSIAKDVPAGVEVVGYETAVAEGKKLMQSGRKLKDYLAKLDPDAGAFMIYTSGTTGTPKGALLTNDNLAFTADLATRSWSLPMARGSLFSFLPLCHIAEKIQNLGVGISQRYTVSFASKFENVSVELPQAEPTLLLCVPRLWEKMMEGVMAKVRGGKGVKKHLAVWALGVGAKAADAKFSGCAIDPVTKLSLPLAEKLVLSKVKKALGLGKAEVLASGAAALPPHVSKWFRSLQLEILEDFGQTESTGVICMTEPGVESAGTVGKGVPGIEVKLAADGEVLTRGRHVFKGYFKNDESTRATIDGEGWLHTGDLGVINDRGLMCIRGRKKEIMKTSGGKMVAPVPIEETLKAAEIISQVCLVGDGRKYFSALITLSDAMRDELKKKGDAAVDVVITSPEVVKQVQAHVDQLNRNLASYEQIKRFAVLSKEFSIADGEMTPTMKMKRSVIEERYRAVIDRMYS